MPRFAWGSHLAILIKAVSLSKGTIVECGTGLYSTPVLHWLSIYEKRALISLEHNREYYNLNRRLEHQYHKIILVKNWRSVAFDQQYGLALVDCNPIGIRTDVIRKLQDRTGMIVLHDTQPTKKAIARYKYHEIYDLFKYRYDYKDVHPNTSVLSNTHDVNEMFRRQD